MDEQTIGVVFGLLVVVIIIAALTVAFIKSNRRS